MQFRLQTKEIIHDCAGHWIGWIYCHFSWTIIALRFKDKPYPITGFSAGAIIGVAVFDLLPEAVELKNESQRTSSLSLLTGIGFIVYMILERMIVLHSTHEGVLNLFSWSISDESNFGWVSSSRRRRAR